MTTVARIRTVVGPIVAMLLLGAVLPPTPEASAQERGVVVPAVPATSLGLGDPLSVVLVEASSGQVLVAHDGDVRRPIASAIKLLTALVVVEDLPEGTAVTVGEEVRGVEGSSYGLRPGETRSVDDLLAGLLLRSGNDAAAALAVAVAGEESAFVGRMEERLRRLGITARPGSASGLEEADALSAAELAVVGRAALAEPRIRALVGLPIVELPGAIRVENRNDYLGDDPTATGLKTGFTSAAGFTLAASAERDGRTLVAVVLGARDDAERRAVARRLLDHGFASTVPSRVDATLDLRTTSGPVELAVDLGTITVPVGTEVRLAWPTSITTAGAVPPVPVLVGADAVGAVEPVRRDGRAAPGPVGLGRALADGVYAALRPGAIRVANERGASGATGAR